MATINIGNPSTAATLDQRRAIADALADPGYTWALRPTASGNTGKVIRITDVGHAGGSMFISDGVNWRSVGEINLAMVNKSPFSPITQNSSGADFLFTLPAPNAGGVKLPGGMFIPGESELNVEFGVRRTGTTGGTATARAWIGPTASAATDSLMVSANLVNTDNSVQNPTVKLVGRSSVLGTVSSFQQRMGTTAAVGAWYDSAGGVINFAVDQFINFGVFAPNAADTYQLFIVRVGARI